jgi:hypothetical protein
MPKPESQFPDPHIQEYNQHNKQSSQKKKQGDIRLVIVPPDPPEFGPAAARALLRLLIAVHRRRIETADTSGEEP